MSQRVYRLDAPTTYDEVHFRGFQLRSEGDAAIQVRYMLLGYAVSSSAVVIAKGRIASWCADWNPETHTQQEHLLMKWCAEVAPAGSLGPAYKGG